MPELLHCNRSLARDRTGVEFAEALGIASHSDGMTITGKKIQDIALLINHALKSKRRVFGRIDSRPQAIGNREAYE